MFLLSLVMYVNTNGMLASYLQSATMVNCLYMGYNNGCCSNFVVSCTNAHNRRIFSLDESFSPVILIDNIYIIEDIMIVKWTAANKNDIDYLELSITSSSDTYEETFPVLKELKEAIVRVTQKPGQYMLTLIAYDICGRNYSSEPSTMNIFESQSTSVQVSTHGLKSVFSTIVIATSMSSVSPVVTPTTLSNCTCESDGKSPLICTLYILVAVS